MRNLLSLAAAALCASSAPAVIVHVEITGAVEWNLFPSGPLAPARPGDPARITFDVDSNDFLDSPTWPTRGYRIIVPSFLMTAGSAQIRLTNPPPAGRVPFFCLRDNDPRVDGFLVSTVVDYPIGVLMDVGYPNMGLEFLRTFTIDTVWDGLDILGALGDYAFENMSSYNWTIGQGEGYVFGAEYRTIRLWIDAPPCPADFNGDGGVDGADVEAFFIAWEVGEPGADTNTDGGIDGADVEVFFTAWEAGGC
jgi:opacity protein-like surface antigen